MKKMIFIVVTLILFYVFGGFSRYNAVTAIVDSINHKYTQVHAGYPRRPELQQRIAAKLGYEIKFSGCMIQFDQFFGQNIYNKISLHFMRKNLGSDVDQKYSSEFKVASDLLSKFDSLASEHPKIQAACTDKPNRIATDILEWHSDRIKFQSILMCLKDPHPIKTITFEIDTIDANNLAITSIIDGFNH